MVAIRYVHVDASRNDDLELPDGRSVKGVRLAELYSEFARLQIPGINSAQGKAELLDSYSAHVTAIAKDLDGRDLSKLPQEAMREAVAFIERQCGELRPRTPKTVRLSRAIFPSHASQQQSIARPIATSKI